MYIYIYGLVQDGSNYISNEIIAVFHSAIAMVLFRYAYITILARCDSFTSSLQGFFTGSGAIIWLPQCQWKNPEEYGSHGLVLNQTKTQQNIILWMYCVQTSSISHIYMEYLY